MCCRSNILLSRNLTSKGRSYKLEPGSHVSGRRSKVGSVGEERREEKLRRSLKAR